MKHVAKVYTTDMEAVVEKMLDKVMFQQLGLKVKDNSELYPHNHLIINNCVISYFSQEKKEEIQGASYDAILCNEVSDRNFAYEVLETGLKV